MMKKFHRIGYEKGKIFKETRNPTSKSIKKAMDLMGYHLTKKAITLPDGRSSTKEVYLDCILLRDVIGFEDWDISY